MARSKKDNNMVIRSLQTVIKNIMEMYAVKSVSYSFNQDAMLLLDEDSKTA